MKKLFNYALLAAALLVGVNVNAQTVTDEAALIQAFANATDGAVIQLGGDAVDFPITATLNIALTENKAVILDLNGHNLVMTDDVAKGTTMINFTQGNLTIKNDVKATGGSVKNMQKSALDKDSKPTFKKDGVYIQAISVKGSGDSTKADYTILNIKPEVTVEAVEGKIGIIVDAVATPIAKTASAKYQTAFGAVVNVEGKVHGEKYGIQVSGNNNAAPGVLEYNTNVKKFTDASIKFPQVNILSTAEVWSNPTATTNGNGLYVGGYAKVLIKGYVHGSNGVYIKSGDVDIVDAVIKSDNPNTEEINGKGSGTAGCGNAIVIESNSSYAGVTDVNISGDTKVEAVAGYAIQEVITTSTDSKLEGLHIEGGTFIGGSEGGTIASSTATDDKDADEQRVTVTGGSFTDDKADSLIVEGGIITEIKDENGNTIGTMITTDPNAPKGEDKKEVTNIKEIDGKDYVYWLKDSAKVGDSAPAVVVAKNQTVTIKNFTADWGTITVRDSGTLVIDNPAEKDAKLMLMGTAVLTLEPGAKMISKSTLGVETASAANLIISAQEGKMAQFLYHPSVNQGRHPQATVKYISRAKNLTTWDRFGVPAYEGMTLAQMRCETAGLTHYLYVWDNVKDDWTLVKGSNVVMQPFQGLTLTNTSEMGGVIYKFPCEIVGNMNANLDLVDGWNSFSNSYTAYTDVKAYLQGIMKNYSTDIEGSIHTYKNGQETTTEDSWNLLTYADIMENDGPEKELLMKLEPMQAFLIRKATNRTVLGSINYAESVWYPATEDPEFAPEEAPKAPRQMMDMNKVVINLTDAQGREGRLTIREAAEFSADFDNGYDATLYESASKFNFYAATDYANQAQIATNDIEGQVLTLATKGETSFTMSFSNVRGEKMAIRDNMTGDVIEMVDGVTYNFMANANEVSERFTVVSAAKAPTALENAAAKAKAAKFVNKGQVVLQNNGRMFNVLGTELK